MPLTLPARALRRLGACLAALLVAIAGLAGFGAMSAHARTRSPSTT